MAKRTTREVEIKKLRPALTPEARENQLIALSMDLVEERLRNGTASSQETTHFLKLGTQKEILERRKLEKEISLLDAKKQAIDATEETRALFAEAIEAMKAYNGTGLKEPHDYD